MKPVNPYIVGNPIKEQSGFFGRQDIFREVLQVLRQRGSNAIVLFGQRRIGKTSVLLQLEKQLKHSGEFTPVYFDLQDKASKSLAEVLYELSQHISKVTGFPPAKAADFDGTGDYFRDVFLPAVAEKGNHAALVLLFDEFDVLDSRTRTQASEAFFPYLRQWMADVQNVKFVFVIGRRPEDLSIRTMATFKGIQSTRVSFLSRRDAEDVVRQSEKEGTLKWEDAAVDKVMDLTYGHPYFTQLLCSAIWESAHELSPDSLPLITSDAVEKAILPALKYGANAFTWLWDGLPPAERVVVAAMAEVKDETITQDKLIETLNLSGVRLVARELELAPETLIDWEVLIESGGTYRFAVPLLRRWVLANRPLRRVKEELDRLNPLADGLYQTGYGYYDREFPDLDAAIQQLQQALNINPNHLKARLLLGQILLEKGNLIESVNTFDAAYQYDERAARSDLIKALLALAETQDEQLQLTTYERILKIQGDQPLANEKMRAIWIKRGEAALMQEAYEEALQVFETIGDTERIDKVHRLMREKKLALDMQRAESYEKSGQWKRALDTLIELIPAYPNSETLQSRMQIARMNWRDECIRMLDGWKQTESWTQIIEFCDSLGKDFPDDLDLKAHHENAVLQMSVAQKYQEALAAVQMGQADQAKQMLSQVLVANPKHLQAAIMLIESTYGKVSILSEIPPAVYFITSIITLAWSMSVLLAVSGLVAEWLENYYMLTALSARYLYQENFILMGVILTPLVGWLLTFHANKVIGAAYQVRPERLSFAKAFWAHLVFGLGLFYVDRQSGRKWLYPIIALLIPLLCFTWIFYELTRNIVIGNFAFRGMAEGLVAEATGTALLVVLGLYALSFVDVLVSCYRSRRAAPARKETAGAQAGEAMPTQPLSPLRGNAALWALGILSLLSLGLAVAFSAFRAALVTLAILLLFGFLFTLASGFESSSQPSPPPENAAQEDMNQTDATVQPDAGTEP